MRSKNQFSIVVLLIVLLFLFPLQGFSEGHIIVYSLDSSTVGSPPPCAEACLDSTITQAAGTNEWVLFSNASTGMHTVEVATTESGYLIRQSPTDADAVNDPNSEYGNPRYIEVVDNQPAYSAFLFDPVITVSAIVRDAWTMERLENASIEFMVNSGPNIDMVYSEYPWEASYASNWISDAEGNFPTNTILYLDNYDLSLARSGYTLFASNNIISNASAGNQIDIGTLFLYPIDANTNQIADAWETLYFGSGSTVLATDDPDADGMSNRDEYVAGTNPTNYYSGLWVDSMVSSNDFNLTWHTESDRSYVVSGTTNIAADTWVQVGGTWEATNGQVTMSWAETNHHLSWNNNYRVEVVPSWWQGTNQVLIRTNDWPTTESGTNSSGGGAPTIP